jgi:tetratricopeptide (TPR) repeat protein
MANCYDSLGNSQEAVNYLNKIISINPKNSFAYYNLGLLHFKNQDLNNAIGAFEKATKYNKKFGAAFYNLANCYFLKNEYKKAVQNYSKALSLILIIQIYNYNLGLTLQS